MYVTLKSCIHVFNIDSSHLFVGDCINLLRSTILLWQPQMKLGWKIRPTTSDGKLNCVQKMLNRWGPFKFVKIPVQFLYMHDTNWIRYFFCAPFFKLAHSSIDLLFPFYFWSTICDFSNTWVPNVGDSITIDKPEGRYYHQGRNYTVEKTLLSCLWISSCSYDFLHQMVWLCS